MRGIAGVVGPTTPELMSALLNALVPRSQDDERLYCAPGISLGVRRLRNGDSKENGQPQSNEDETLWVVLDGAVYNREVLREELIHKGHRFATRDDAELLAHLYEEDGVEGVGRLRGMFAYALWDHRARRLLLARDRLGIKPLYYVLRPETKSGTVDLIFSTEMGSLVNALQAPRIRRQALIEYLTWLYVPTPGSLYEGLCQVPPGHLLICEAGSTRLRRYASYAPAAFGLSWSSIEEAADHFMGLFRETVQCHLAGDAPVGVLLSGGLDSAAMLAMMRQTVQGPIKTFSVRYETADRDDREHDAAQAIARRFDTDHNHTVVRPELPSLLPKIVGAMGEPFADPAAVLAYFASEAVGQSVAHALSAVGGDVLFGGYPRHLGIRLAAEYQRCPSALRRVAASAAGRWLPDASAGKAHLGRLKRFLRWGTESLSEQYYHWTSHLPPEWGLGAFQDGFAPAPGRAPSDATRRRFDEWYGADPADRAMGVDLQSYLPDDLLRVGDRMGRLHSLEFRVPFCDHYLLAFALSLPVSVRFRGAQLNGFLRHAFRHMLPPSVVKGPRLGARVPTANWIKNDLAEMVGDLLGPAAVRRRGILRAEYVRWLIEEHSSGRRNFADQLYAALVLELWMRQQSGHL